MIHILGNRQVKIVLICVGILLLSWAACNVAWAVRDLYRMRLDKCQERSFTS